MIVYNGKEYKSLFDVQMHILFSVLGATHQPEMLTNKYLSQILKVDEAQISRRRSGKITLRDGDASAIIGRYGLNDNGLDHFLFDIEDPYDFLESLKRHGVGVYQFSPRRLLTRELHGRVQNNSLKIEIHKKGRHRGIVYGSGPHLSTQVFRPGASVEIFVRGKIGRHIAVVQVPDGIEHSIVTLAPTSALPLTELVDSTLVLPNFGDIPFLMAKPSGMFKLYAVEADQNLIELFAGDDLVEKDDGHTVREKFFEAVPLSDTHAAVILESLKKRIHKEVRVSSVEFVVE